MGASIGPNRSARNPQPQPATTSEGGIIRATHRLYCQPDCQPGRPGKLGPEVYRGRSGACAMTGILALACFVTGFIVAWLVRMIFVMAEISWSQERMQRKVRYWQGEAIDARDRTEQLIRQLAVSTGREPESPDWPAARIS
jgi:hypothetical protein